MDIVAAVWAGFGGLAGCEVTAGVVAPLVACALTVDETPSSRRAVTTMALTTTLGFSYRPLSVFVWFIAPETSHHRNWRIFS